MVAGPPNIPIAAGIAVGVASSLIQSLGLTIQRKSHVQNDALSEDRRRPDYRRPLWLFGFGIFITSNVLGSVFQIGTLPIVILAPLGAISLLWNAVFARLLLGDSFSAFMGLGTLLVAGGAVLIGIFGVLPTPAHSLDSLIALFARAPFAVYFSLLLTATFVLLVISHTVEWRYHTRLYGASPAATPPLSAQPMQQTPSESTLLLQPHTSEFPSDGITSRDGPRLFLALSYAVLSGVLSGFGLLFAKSGVELLVLTFSGDNQFWRWQAWALIPALIFFALSNLWYLHKSLILADPTLVCPLSFCFFNLSSILDSLIYFDQFRLLSPLQLWMILLGTALLLAGVWLLSLQSARGVKVSDGITGPWVEAAEVLTASPGQIEAPLPEVEVDEADDEAVPMSPTSRFRTLLSPSRSVHTLPGFAIGLSPVSPGFSLSPPRRRVPSGVHPSVVEQEVIDPSDVQSRDSSLGARAEKRSWWKPWSVLKKNA